MLSVLGPVVTCRASWGLLDCVIKALPAGLCGKVLRCRSMLELVGDEIRGHVEVCCTEPWNAFLFDFSHSFHKYLLSIYYVPGSVLDAECYEVVHMAWEPAVM